ncbi:MAG: hypothetical protein WDA16_05270 [Candidatus Thermoplasmatota archaeon]
MIRLATPVILALLAISTASSSLASAATTKASGVPDSTALQLSFTNATTILVRLDQKWENARGAEMRQSLDAYFGNGDGKLSFAEISRITAAASNDMRDKTFAPLTVDGAAVRVSNVSVSLSGAEANETGARLSIHHEITLATPPMEGGRHTIALASTWNGTYSIEPPAGLAVNDATSPGPVTGPLSSGTSVGFTIAPPTPPPTIVTPAESVAAPAPVLPVNHNTPGPTVVSVAIAVGLTALLLAWSRRR